MSFKASATSKRKENSPRARLPFDLPLLTALQPQFPAPGFRNFDRIPCPPMPWLAASLPKQKRSSHRPFQGGFPRGSGPTNPCPSTVHMETNSTSVFCVLTQNNRYYNQDLHQVNDPRRLTPHASSRPLRPPTRLWLFTTSRAGVPTVICLSIVHFRGW